jgi:hypothetical protein
MNKVILFIVLFSLCKSNVGQNWIAPDGGFYGQHYSRMFADEVHNVLYTFAKDTNVLVNGKWKKWYPNTNGLLEGRNPIQYTNGYLYDFREYYLNNDPYKPVSALIKWSNATDLDTISVYKGQWSVGGGYLFNNKFYVTVGKDTIVNQFNKQYRYKSTLAEFDGNEFKNFWFDTLWSVINTEQFNGVGSLLNFNGETWLFGAFRNGVGGAAIYRNNKWEVFPIPIYGSVVKYLTYNNRLYAIGGFWKEVNPNNPGNGIAAWDGVKWDGVGGGVVSTANFMNGYFNDAVVCNNKIYFISTHMDYVSGFPASYVVSWNDTSWCTHGSDLYGTLGNLWDIECFRDTVYILNQGGWKHNGNEMGVYGKLQNMSFADSCRYMPVGLKENNLAFNFSFYPNPVKHKLKIELGSKTIQSIYLSDILGQIIYQAAPTSKEIDFSSFANGVYFLTITSDNRKKVFKIIKE